MKILIDGKEITYNDHYYVVNQFTKKFMNDLYVRVQLTNNIMDDF